MPHLIIESSLPIPKTTADKLHQLVGQQETVSLSSVKTRVYTPTHSISHEPNHTAITLKLLSGRSPELKKEMAANLLAAASKLITEGALSVEVTDLGTYTKPGMK